MSDHLKGFFIIMDDDVPAIYESDIFSPKHMAKHAPLMLAPSLGVSEGFTGICYWAALL